MRSLALSIVLVLTTVFAPATAAQESGSPSRFEGFISDVAHDYVHSLSRVNLPVVVGGSTGAAMMGEADAEVADEAWAAAAYVGAERVTENTHWPSDVVFGATMGILAGRTVTLHVRGTRLSVQPQPARRGGGVLVHVDH